MAGLKQALRRVPVLGSLAERVYRRLLGRAADEFPGSAAYWSQRYRSGGNSGAGSYDRLAAFKAEIINAFVVEHAVLSVLEFGCGDGAQLARANYPSYVGVDVAEAAVALCRAKFRDDPSKTFWTTADLPADCTAELTLSLDVIYHLVEDEVYQRYMQDLFARSSRFVCIYSSNEDRLVPDRHVRHRHVTDWADRNALGWRLLRHVPNRYPLDPADPANTSFADFYFYARA